MYLQTFSPPHLIVLAIFAAMAALIIVYRKTLAAWRGEPRLRLVATIVAVSFEFSLHVLQYLTHGYTVRFRTLVKAIAFLFPITIALRLLDQAFAGEH